MKPAAWSRKRGLTGPRLGLVTAALSIAVVVVMRRRRSRHRKAYKGLPMEGFIARWYGRLRSSQNQLELYRRQALELTEGLPTGGAVLEVAPGPGYLAIEIARLGHYQVTAIDISRSFVQITADNAARAQVSVDVRQGDAAKMPFGDESFDLVVCQAAFKNLAYPVDALNEMHRELAIHGIETVNIGSGVSVAVGQMVDMILAAAGCDVKVTVDPAKVRAAERSNLCASTNRLKNLIGYAPEPAGPGTIRSILNEARHANETAHAGRLA